MKIYTKKGDTGTTQLIGGTRVSKSHIRIEAYGTVDELNSWIGVVRDHFQDKGTKTALKEIQDRLFTIGSSLASDPEKSKMKIPDLLEEDIVFLENQIDEMNEKLPEMTSFILPGGHHSSSFCHVARCICRNAERQSVHLADSDFVDPKVIQYLNRLSDYLFVLSRFALLENDAVEIPWKPRIQRS